MTETAFTARADETLQDLMDRIDEDLGDILDVDMQNGILTLESEDGRQFVINKHGPNKQIWMSSPVSGAAHFDYDPDSETWVASRDGSELRSRLAADLKSLTGQQIDLA